MPSTECYVKRNQTKDGEFSGRLYADNHAMLDLWCRINNKNKTQELNRIVRQFLDDKFARLKEGEE